MDREWKEPNVQNHRKFMSEFRGLPVAQCSQIPEWKCSGNSSVVLTFFK